MQSGAVAKFHQGGRRHVITSTHKLVVLLHLVQQCAEHKVVYLHSRQSTLNQLLSCSFMVNKENIQQVPQCIDKRCRSEHISMRVCAPVCVCVCVCWGGGGHACLGNVGGQEAEAEAQIHGGHGNPSPAA